MCLVQPKLTTQLPRTLATKMLVPSLVSNLVVGFYLAYQNRLRRHQIYI